MKTLLQKSFLWDKLLCKYKYHLQDKRIHIFIHILSNPIFLCLGQQKVKLNNLNMDELSFTKFHQYEIAKMSYSYD